METCKACGYTRSEDDTAPDWQCPSCERAYVKTCNRDVSSHTEADAIQASSKWHVQHRKQIVSLAVLLGLATLLLVGYVTNEELRAIRLLDEKRIPLTGEELQYRIRLNDYEAVELLLIAGTDPNFVDRNSTSVFSSFINNTPLGRSRNEPPDCNAQCVTRITTLFVESGLDLHSTDSSGNTPLMHAIQRLSEPAAKALIKNSDLSMLDDFGRNLYEQLFALTDRISLQTERISYPYIDRNSIENAVERIVDLLIDNSFDLSSQNISAAAKYPNVVRKMLSLGADPYGLKHNGNLLSHNVLYDSKLVAELFEMGIDFDRVDHDGNGVLETGIWWYSFSYNMAMFNLLVDLQKDPLKGKVEQRLLEGCKRIENQPEFEERRKALTFLIDRGIRLKNYIFTINNKRHPIDEAVKSTTAHGCIKLIQAIQHLADNPDQKT